MINMLPVFFNSVVFSRWRFPSRKPKPLAVETVQLPTANDVPIESPKDIKTLLEAARASGSLHDLQEFLLAAKEGNLQIALILKFHDIDLLSVVSGTIQLTQLGEHLLKIRFHEFSNQDYEKARAVIDKVTNGKGRSFNPPYVVYWGNDIVEVSNQTSNCHEVKGIYLISELPDNKIKIE